MEEEIPLDPTPLTEETFFVSADHWRFDAGREAMAGRGSSVDAQPLGASEEAIAAAEQRLGIRLPELLRRLYRRMDGGYVGTLYVPLKEKPALFYDDWRGAFAIDYSSLCPVSKLRTVYERYQDFTHDPDEEPEHADRLIVLQSRYGDMTLLDYSEPGEPRVVIADFDQPEDPIDCVFPSFDAFFAALRRVQPEADEYGEAGRFLSPPLGRMSAEQRPAVFWLPDRHPFANSALSGDDGWEPQPQADDELIRATEARLGYALPPLMQAIWRARSGGVPAYRFWIGEQDERAVEHTAWEGLAPLEYVVTLAELSARIRFPAGVVPWAAKADRPEALVVLETSRGAMVLLDYRQSETDPGLILVDDMEAATPLETAVRFASFETFVLEQLRKFQR